MSKSLLNSFKNPAKAAISIASVALVAWLAKILIFDYIPEYFSGGAKLGKVFEAISSAIVTGFVFHLFYSRLNDLDQRKHLLPYLDRHLKRIKGDCIAISDQLAKASGMACDFEKSDKNQIEIVLKAIPFDSNPDMVVGLEGRSATWMEYFDFQRSRSQRSIARLLQQSSYLDAKTTALLVEIDDCSHFSSIEQLRMFSFRNADLSCFTSSLSQYFALCRKIAD